MSEFLFPVGVRGWLSHEEGYALWELARGKRVLEIGSFCGKSTICLAQSALVVHAVDWHRGDWAVGQTDTLPEMWRNLKKHGVQDRTIIHVGKTQDMEGLFQDGVFDLVFIDGAHDAASVAYDTNFALRVLTPDGVLSFHDWHEKPVRQGAEPLLPTGTRQQAGNLMWIHLQERSRGNGKTASLSRGVIPAGHPCHL